MSEGRGNEPAPAGDRAEGASKRPNGAAAARRLGLLTFGAAFLILFVVVAIAEGLGDPGIPDGDVILVEDAPGDAGHISRREFDRTLKQTATQAQLPKTPKPGDPQYDELKESTINNLLEFVWLEGLAEEMGITVSDREVQAELKKVKGESFPSKGEYEKFLKESGLSQADVDRQVRVQALSAKIQKELEEREPKPGESEIENYYEAAKATQFTELPKRTLRQIVNGDREKAKRAKNALDKSHTAKDWERVAKRYSEEGATKDSGGLQESVTQDFLGEPFGKTVFSAPVGQVGGPVESQGRFYVFEVLDSAPEGAKPLSEVEDQIKSQLEQTLQQEYFNAFVADFNQKWTSRTFCAEGYVTARCADFKGDGHPATAPPGCYEADPEGGLPAACPAPVFQLVPALPGSVTPLKPQGEPRAQRPLPAAGDEDGSEAATGLPPGAVPPTGAPPTGE